jgi:hypothetical protein
MGKTPKALTCVPVREFMKFKPMDMLKGLRRDHRVVFDDGIVKDMKSRDLILSRYIWMILEEFKELPIKASYTVEVYYKDGYYNGKSINSALSHIYKDIVNNHIKVMDDNRAIDHCFKSMYKIINTIYVDFPYNHPEYITGINIKDFWEIQKKKKLLESINQVNLSKQVEDINMSYMIMDEILRSEEFKDNPLAIAYKSGGANPNQVKQELGPVGFRTELDSSIYNIPTANSFTLGMDNMYSMAVESRSAAKSLFFSTKAIQQTEYFGREIQLTAMSVRHIEYKDCGTTKYTNWYVEKNDLKVMEGMYHFDKNGNSKVIESTDTHLIGKIIKLRTPHNCALEDKHNICAKCFGDMAYSVFPHTNIGHISGTTVSADISQKVLSTKHLISSASGGSIALTEITSKFFRVYNKNEFAINPELLKNNDKVEILIDYSECFGLGDIYSLQDLANIAPAKVSRISVITFKITDKKGKVHYESIPMGERNKKVSFTNKFLVFMSNNGHTLDNQDRYVIDITKWKSKTGIFVKPMVEFSYLDLAKDVKKLLMAGRISAKKENRKTPDVMLMELHNIINSKLQVNLTLLSVLVYALTVRDDGTSLQGDLSRNAENPTVSNMKEVIGRTLGSGYAHEAHLDILYNPNMFIPIGVTDHPLDAILMPEEVINHKYGVGS